MEIKGYENYLIYNDGKVYSLLTNKILKPNDNQNGYLYVNLCKNNKSKSKFIHRLVAEHYIENLNNNLHVDHINRNRTDNRVENLRWVTRHQNMRNTKIRKDSKFTEKNIRKLKSGSYFIQFNRYKLNYFYTCETLEKAIIQRNLMLSMWN